MSTHVTAPDTVEWFFRDYGAQLRHPDLPLVVLRQIYERGGDTGTFQHEDFYALYLVESGRGIHVINGHPYAIARGDVYITPPGTVHAYRDYHELRALAFCFQASLFALDELEALRSLPGFWHLFVRPDNTSFQNASSPRAEQAGRGDYHLHLSPEQWREMAEMGGRIEAELQPNGSSGDSPVTKPLARGLFFHLLVALARHQTGHDAEKHDGIETRNRDKAWAGDELAGVLRFCEERFAEPISVPQLAARMFLSPGRFSLLFSRRMGMPPAAYIRRLRLERAQNLLRTSTLSTTHIARQCGFNNGAQFSRLFRAAFGLTPTAYRKDFRRGG